MSFKAAARAFSMEAIAASMLATAEVNCVFSGPVQVTEAAEEISTLVVAMERSDGSAVTLVTTATDHNNYTYTEREGLTLRGLADHLSAGGGHCPLCPPAA